MDNPVPETPQPPEPPTIEKPTDFLPKAEPQVGFPQMPVPVAPPGQPIQPTPPTPATDHTGIIPGNEKPKSKNNLLMIVAIILLLVALAVLGFFIFQNIQKRQTPAETTPTPTASPTPTPDPTANWKTYKNTEYGFSIKYPNNFPDFETTVYSSSDESLDIIRKQFSTEVATDYVIAISIWDNPAKLTTKSWVDIKAKRPEPLAGWYFPTKNFDTTPNYTIGGKEALRYWSDPVSNGKEPGDSVGGWPNHYVDFANDDIFFQIHFEYFRKVNNEDVKILSQILSTFNFVGPTPTVTIPTGSPSASPTATP